MVFSPGWTEGGREFWPKWPALNVGGVFSFFSLVIILALIPWMPLNNLNLPSLMDMSLNPALQSNMLLIAGL